MSSALGGHDGGINEDMEADEASRTGDQRAADEHERHEAANQEQEDEEEEEEVSDVRHGDFSGHDGELPNAQDLLEQDVPQLERPDPDD
ncbi:hypothetical protein LTR53_013460, partial [Teratosphaeriaceae sp. CCFEE 6253]